MEWFLWQASENSPLAHFSDRGFKFLACRGPRKSLAHVELHLSVHFHAATACRLRIRTSL